MILPPRATAVAFALLAVTIFASCEHAPPDYGPGDGSISFELALPRNIGSGADYYGFAGVRSERQPIYINDSTIEDRDVNLFYAQFYPGKADTVPFSVRLNSVTFKQHRNTDTLRLGSTFDTTLVRGTHTWRLMDGDRELTRWVVEPVAPLDTIAPLQTLRETKGAIRYDTAFTISWKPASTPGALQLEWRSPGDTIIRDLADFTGSYTIPAEVMRQLRGRGTVILTRYRTASQKYDGKTVTAVRLAQRIYPDVYVQ